MTGIARPGPSARARMAIAKEPAEAHIPTLGEDEFPVKLLREPCRQTDA